MLVDTAKFRRLMKEKGVTIPELAEIAGVQKSQMDYIITNKRNANAPTMLRIAEFFGCKVEDLYTA